LTTTVISEHWKERRKRERLPDGSLAQKLMSDRKGSQKNYIYVPLPEELHKKLKVKCAQEGVPMTVWVADLLARELKNVSITWDSIGSCPLCGAAVMEGSRSYSCSNWRNGCNFLIWKEIAHRRITPREAITLLSQGHTEVLQGFKSKTNKEFAASLAIQGAKAVFVFNKAKSKEQASAQAASQ